MDLQFLGHAARKLGISDDTLARRIKDGTIPATAVSRNVRAPGAANKVTLVDVDAARLALASPEIRAALRERDDTIEALRQEVAALRAERDQLEAAIASGAVELQADSVIERHGLRSRQTA